jgi:rhodanese-related sulfurtransferase
VLFSYALVTFAKVPPSPENIKGTQKITAETVIQHVEKIPGLIIIDSRIASDRELGYIEDSISLPDGETSCTTLSAILPKKKTHVIFYCNGPKCGRSAVAVKIAIQCGYSNTYWFRGGFEEWKQKKYPFVTNQ